MAIKGKKKSQQRGSQGVRRPAGAPRPAVGSSRGRTPFYKTRDGMLILGIFVLVFLGVIAWLVGSARERSQELEASRAGLERYSEEAEKVIGTATTPIREMVELTQLDPEVVDSLKEDSERWTTELQQVQGSLAQIFPEPQVLEVNQLFNEAFALYGAAAETFALVPDAKGELRQQIFTRASVQRDTASALFETAIAVLNRMRSDKDLPASGLLPPAGPSVPQMEDPSNVEIPVDELEGLEEDPAGDGAEGADEDTGQEE